MSGGKLFVYAPGTATPKTPYADAAGAAELSNPVILDKFGEKTIWLDGYAKLILKNDAGKTVWVEDNAGGSDAEAVGVFSEIATTTTPASGTCAVQLVLSDVLGDALATVQSGMGFISTVAGVLSAAVTSVATLTNGSISTLVTGQVFMWASKADGTLGVTVTGAANSYYITLVKPDGSVVVSDEIVVNA